MSQSINFFVAYTAQELKPGVAVSSLVLDRITTLTGETIETSDFSTLGRGVITINPKADGETSFPESVEFTGVTAATKTLIGITRGLDKDGTADTDLMRYHPVGTEVILSFGAHQIQDLIDYINSLVVTTRSVVFEGVAGETISAGDLIYLDDTDNEWKLCDADTPTTVENVMLGIAQGAGVNGGNIATGILVTGHDTTNTGLTQGQKYYASNTPGELSSTPGTTEVTIGYGSATGNLYFQPRFDQQITEDEQDALQGSSGTPSNTNRYLTNDDTSNAGVADKLVRPSGTTLPILDGSNLTNISSATTSLQTLTAFEAINGATTPQMVAIADESVDLTVTMLDVTTGGAGGAIDRMDAATIQMMQSFVTPMKYNRLKTVGIQYSRNNSPIFILNCDIYADNGSDEPTGASLGNAQVDVAATGNGFITFTFATTISLTPGVKYVAVFSATSVSTLNGTNWIELYNSSADVYTGVTKNSIDSGVTWINSNSNDACRFVGGFEATAGQAIIAGTEVDRQYLVGVSNTNVAATSGIAPRTGGIMGGFTGLTAGDTYYLGAYGTISTTAGSPKIRVGKAISSTQLYIDIQFEDSVL